MRYALAMLAALVIGGAVTVSGAFADENGGPALYENGVAASSVAPTPVDLTSASDSAAVAGPVQLTQNGPLQQINIAVGNDGGGQ